MRRLLSLFAAFVATSGGYSAAVEYQIVGEPTVWTPLAIEFQGPRVSETGQLNPFRDLRMDVHFSSGEATFVVPGYFAADGDAANSGAEQGNIWRAHFVPQAAGDWNFEAKFYAGAGAALPATARAAQEIADVRTTGTFTVAEDENAKGLIQHAGGRYLTYSGDGSIYLKAGADSPENFLGYADFDGTRSLKNAGENRDGEAATAPLHRYEPHLGDWRSGDPTWGEGRGKGIIGALNYLAGAGVNSVYFMTMNVEGDGQDVWPHVAPDDFSRFDCSKLEQWNLVFDHMDRLGISLHVVLTETENESLFEVREGLTGEGTFAEARKLYYRELVARFAHHRGVVWNLGEENGGDDRPPRAVGNSDRQRRAFAEYLKAVDPYQRPVVVHTYPGDYDKIYSPLLGVAAIDGPSLQISSAERVHAETLKWIRQSHEAGRPWFVCFDELGPAADGVVTDEEDPRHDDVRRHCLWGCLMAGGAGVEWYFGYQHPHNDLNLEDFRSRAEMWRQTSLAVEFFQGHLSPAEMRPADQLATADATAYCLATRAAVYAVYLTRGDSGAQVELSPGKYRVQWFDPIDGGELQAGSIDQVATSGLKPSFKAIGSPPREGDRDWLALVTRLSD